MNDDNFNFNDAPPQRDPERKQELLPPDVYHLQIEALPGGVVDPLCLAKNQRTSHLEVKYTVIGGDYDGCSLYDNITLRFDDTEYEYNDPDAIVPPPLTPKLRRNYTEAVKIGRAKVRAILESAFAIDPKDQSPEACRKRDIGDLLKLTGLEFWGRVEIKKGTDKYPDKNELYCVVTPNMADWPQSDERGLVPRSNDLRDEIPY